MEINPDFASPCGLYCGVCAIYIAHRDNNEKLKQGLVNLYKGKVPGKGALPNCEDLSTEDIKCGGCLSDEPFMHCLQCEIRICTKEKGYTGCHELLCGPFHIGERSVLKNGCKMKKPAMSVPNAAIKCSGVLLNAISAKQGWIWTSFLTWFYI
jgi:hypothetical protein